MRWTSGTVQQTVAYVCEPIRTDEHVTAAVRRAFAHARDLIAAEWGDAWLVQSFSHTVVRARLDDAPGTGYAVSAVLVAERVRP